MASPDEQQLITASQRGDAVSFGLLYDAYARKIYDFIYYRTHHKETAEDLMSDVFMKAYAGIGRFDASKGGFSAWIYRIARNRVIDHYRTDKKTENIEDVWDVLAGGGDIARDTDARERLTQVEKNIAKLPAAQRAIILMRVWDQLSYAEIAEVLGKSEAACKMSFSRGLAALRASMPLVLLLIILLNPLST